MTDVVVHAEVVRTQELLAQLQADIAAARQEIADVQQVAAGSAVKRVLRGSVVAYPAGTVVTLPGVVVEKSVLSFVSTRSVGDGVAAAYMDLLSPTELRVTANESGVSVYWQLVEYY